MGKLPAFQFYPGDWQKDPCVRSCTLEEKGAWFEILLAMNEAPERGKIPVDGAENILGVSKQKSSKLLAKLQAKGVANIEQNFIICRRMLREQNLREIRRFAGSLGGSKSQAKAKQDGQAKSRSSSSSSSSSSSLKKEKIYSPDSIRLSELLLSLIKERKPDFRENGSGKWPEEVDHMLHLDKGRTPEKIEEVIRWCQQDKFWKKVILSTASLRKHFDKLEISMNERSEYIC